MNELVLVEKTHAHIFFLGFYFLFLLLLSTLLFLSRGSGRSASRSRAGSWCGTSRTDIREQIVYFAIRENLGEKLRPEWLNLNASGVARGGDFIFLKFQLVAKSSSSMF